jgi:hypothetical protein
VTKLKESLNHMKPIRRILILSANPIGTARLRLDEEFREIEEGLRRSKYRDQCVTHSKWAVRLRDLRRALLDYEPHIVHFTGHGNKEGLLVEEKLGIAKSIFPEALSGLFALFSDKIECVILNACYSEHQADAISKHIDYVIGMQKEIEDKAAIEFVVGFYDALGAGKSFEKAFKFGCNAILQSFPDLSEHLIPILMTKKGIQNNNFPIGEVKVPKDEEEKNTPHSQLPGKICSIALKAHNGKYVAAVGEGGGKLAATSEKIKKWEIFNVIELPGKKVILQIHNGQYVHAKGGGGGELIAASSSPQAFEMFEIITLEDDKIALQAHDGHFVSFEDEGECKLLANSPKIRAREIFIFTKLETKRGEE